MSVLRTRSAKGSELSHAELDANFKRTVSAKTTTYACLVGDNRSVIECNHATIPFTVTLGDAATMAAAETGDYEVTIANIGAATVTVARAGTDTIDGGATSITLPQYSAVTLKVNAAGNGYNTVANHLGSGDTPQYIGIELGHASDTTLTRASAGDINIEGNIAYRSGGTDVPVSDGGTGASSAADARTNLGVPGLTSANTFSGLNTFFSAPTISATSPAIKFIETGVTADNAKWRIVVDAEKFRIDTISDSEAAYESAIEINRTGEVIDTVNFPNGTLQSGGSTVWHSGNDGTGSGLDADTVDGVEASGLVQVANNLSDVTAAAARTNLDVYSTAEAAPLVGYILVRDEKTQNTDGGTFTLGAWRTRDINTEVTDTGGNCAISSNQITLDAGTYECLIKCPAYHVDEHQARLQNVTDASTTLLGTAERAASGAGVQTSSVIMGRFTIAAQKTFEIQHQSTVTGSTTGFGYAANITTEIYTVAEFRKVA